VFGAREFGEKLREDSLVIGKLVPETCDKYRSMYLYNELKDMRDTSHPVKHKEGFNKACELRDHCVVVTSIVGNNTKDLEERFG
jgi:hypothetical protein